MRSSTFVLFITMAACSGDDRSVIGDAGGDTGAPEDAGSTSDTGTADSAVAEPMTLQGWLNVQTEADLAPTFAAEIRSDVPVRVLDSDPEIQGVSDAEGIWTIEVPYGVHMIHADTPENWGAVIGTVFDRINRFSYVRCRGL